MHRQFCFSNFSTTNERIFMKFETEAVSIQINQHIYFHDDPCVHVHVRITMKINMLGHRSTDSLSFKFHEDPSIG